MRFKAPNLKIDAFSLQLTSECFKIKSANKISNEPNSLKINKTDEMVHYGTYTPPETGGTRRLFAVVESLFNFEIDQEYQQKTTKKGTI